MIEHNLTIVVSTFLFTVTMVPSVYLRYLPFRPILDEQTRKSLLHGYHLLLRELPDSIAHFFKHYFLHLGNL